MNIGSIRQRNCIAVFPVKDDNEKNKIREFTTIIKEKTTVFFAQAYTYVKTQAQNLFATISSISIPKPRILLPHIRLKLFADFIISRLMSHIHRSVIAFTGMLLWLAVFLVVFSTYFTGGYQFVVDGKTIGYSTDKNAYNVALNSVNAELGSTFGELAKINKSADRIVRIIKKDSLTSNEDFRSNVAALSEFMIKACVLYINGEETIGFKSEKDLYDAIEAFKTSFGQGDSIILDDIKTEEKYVTAASVYSVQSAQRFFSSENGLRVQTVTKVTDVESIDFEKEEISDGTLYKDQSETLQTGEFGEKTITSLITAVNGVQVSREILSEIVTKEPVKEIVKIGTKKRPTGVGSGEFLFPTSGTISSRFGSRWGTHHDGLDITNSIGTPIKAADEGIVTFAGVQNGYGNIIIINHNNGYETCYGHCDTLLANVGDIVEKGQIIATMGDSGKSTGPHLHFEVRKNGTAQNPENYVNR